MDVYDAAVTMMINDIIELANRAIVSTSVGTKLQFCIDFAKQNRRDKGEEDWKYRDIELYFQARIGTIDGRMDFSDYLAGRTGAWARSILDRGWMQEGNMPVKILHPSDDRLGKWSRHDEGQPIPGPYDSALRWAANGAADRFRDYGVGEGALQRHERPPSHNRTRAAFRRAQTD